MAANKVFISGFRHLRVVYGGSCLSTAALSGPRRSTVLSQLWVGPYFPVQNNLENVAVARRFFCALRQKDDSGTSAGAPRSGTTTESSFPTLARRVWLQTAKLSFLLFLLSAAGLKGLLFFYGPSSSRASPRSDLWLWFALFDDLVSKFESVARGAIPFLSLPHFLQGREGLVESRWPNFLNFLVLWRAEVTRADHVSSSEQESPIPVVSDKNFLGRAHRFARAANAAFPPDLLVRLGLCDHISPNAFSSKEEFMERYAGGGVRVVCTTNRPEKPTILSELTKLPLTKHVTRPFAWMGIEEKTVVVSIRGTVNLEDAMTDALCDSKLMTLSGLQRKILVSAGEQNATGNSAEKWLSARTLRKHPSFPGMMGDSPKFWAHEGMLLSAEHILREFLPDLAAVVEREGVTKVVFTGNSLGGGSAQVAGGDIVFF